MKYPIIKSTNVSLFRKNLKQYIDSVIESESILLVNRPMDTFVVLAEETYNSLIRKVNELEYELKILNSIKQVEEGNLVTKTMKELEQYV